MHLSRTLRWREPHPFSHIALRNHASKFRSPTRGPGSTEKSSLCCTTSGDEKSFCLCTQPALVAKTLGEFQPWSRFSLTSSVLLHLCAVEEGHGKEPYCLLILW